MILANFIEACTVRANRIGESVAIFVKHFLHYLGSDGKHYKTSDGFYYSCKEN